MTLTYPGQAALAALALFAMMFALSQTAARQSQHNEAAQTAAAIAFATLDADPNTADRHAAEDGALLAALAVCGERRGQLAAWQRIRAERGLLEAEHAVVHQVLAEPLWLRWIERGDQRARCAAAINAAAMWANRT